MLVTSRDPTEKMSFLLRNVHFGSKHLFLLSMRKILSIDFTSQTSIRYNSVFSWLSHPNQVIQIENEATASIPCKFFHSQKWLSARWFLLARWSHSFGIFYRNFQPWRIQPISFPSKTRRKRMWRVTTPLRSMLKNNSLNGVSRQARPKRRTNGGVWPLFRLVQVLVKRAIAMMNPVRILVIQAVPRAGLNQTTGDTIILLTRPRMYKVKLNCLVICRDICMTNSHLKLRTRRFKSRCLRQIRYLW